MRYRGTNQSGKERKKNNKNKKQNENRKVFRFHRTTLKRTLNDWGFLL